MKKTVFMIVSAVLLLVFFMVTKTVSFKPKQVDAEQAEATRVDVQKAVQNLSRAVKFRTISDSNQAKINPLEFESFHQFLEEAFPRLHDALIKEVIDDYGLLYTWKGKDSNVKPILLMAHMDVVPIAQDTLNDWHYPPFEGRVAEGFVWGRGTLDDKLSLLGIMEAVEALLTENYTPRRTIYLAFGHDEEVGGQRGALQIARILISRGGKCEYILDESGAVATGILPWISSPVALIGIAEKGYLTLKLSVEHEGGHSSMPSLNNAIGILATAIHNLDKNPFPSRLDGTMGQFFEYVGPELPPTMKFFIANKWLFGGLIKSQLKGAPSSYALIHTTTATTVVRAGQLENMLPQRAEAVVNLRLLPGDTIDYAIEYVKRAVGDQRVKVSIAGNSACEASKISDVRSEGFKILERTIRQVFPDSLVAPFLVPASTDARHYSGISDSILRFLPIRMDKDDFKRIHGTNERIGVDNYKSAVEFYIQLIRNSN